MGWSRVIEHLRGRDPQAVKAIRGYNDPQVYPKGPSALQISRRVTPVLGHIAKHGIGSDDPDVIRGVGLAIEKLHADQEAARNAGNTDS